MNIKFALLALAIGLGAATQTSAGDINTSTLVHGQFNKTDVRVEVHGFGIPSGPRAHAPVMALTARHAVRTIMPPSRITSLTIGRNNTTWIDSRGHGQRIHVETRGQDNTTNIRVRN